MSEASEARRAANKAAWAARQGELEQQRLAAKASVKVPIPGEPEYDVAVFNRIRRQPWGEEWTVERVLEWRTDVHRRAKELGTVEEQMARLAAEEAKRAN